MTESQPDPATVSLLSPPAAPVTRWRLWLASTLIIPLPLLLGLAGAGRQESRQAALSETWQGLLKVGGMEVAVFGVILTLVLWLSQPSRDDLRLRFDHPLRLLFLGIGYSVGIRLALGILAGLVVGVLLATHAMTPASLQSFASANRPDIETVVSIKALKNDPAYYWLTLTVISFIVAGLREELWRTTSLAALRRLSPRWFGTRGGEYGAVLLTSVLFGIGHLSQGVIAVCATAVIGALLGFVMVLHRSIWPSVIAHGFFDAASFALLPLVLDKLPVPP